MFISIILYQNNLQKSNLVSIINLFDHNEEYLQLLAFFKEKTDLFCNIKVNNAVLLGKSKLVKQKSKQQFFYRQITASHEKFQHYFLQIANLTDFPQISAIYPN